MNLVQFPKSFIQSVRRVVEKHVDELHKKLPVHFALFAELLLVNAIRPDALDDLEDLVSNLKLVVECVADAAVFTL